MFKMGLKMIKTLFWHFFEKVAESSARLLRNHVRWFTAKESFLFTAFRFLYFLRMHLVWWVLVDFMFFIDSNRRRNVTRLTLWFICSFECKEELLADTRAASETLDFAFLGFFLKNSAGLWFISPKCLQICVLGCKATQNNLNQQVEASAD